VPLPRDTSFRQFLLFIFALIIPCFAIWTLLAGPVAMPVVGLANIILKAWFPAIVDGLLFQGSDILLMTQFGELNGRAVPPEQAEYQLGFSLNPAILSYSLPFYATLHFATAKEDYFGSFVAGVLALYPLILLGLVSLCLKELMVNLGGLFFDQPGTFVPNGNVIALLYQLNVLIVPTVAPILLWAWQSRDTRLVRGMLNLPAKEEDEPERFI
jgi:hypothetical protein